MDDCLHREVVNLLTRSKAHVQLTVQRDPLNGSSDATYPTGSATSDSEVTSADYFLTPIEKSGRSSTSKLMKYQSPTK